VSWKVVGASVTGDSHIQSSAPCQDSCFYHVSSDATGAAFLVALVSDGAGSAQFGEVGSEIACERGGKILLERVEAIGEQALTTACAIEMLDCIRSEIDKAAAQREVTTRALACTLLGAVVGPTQALYFQVGDGAIVTRQSEGLSPVFWPESGEYANMTYFVTDENAADHFRSEVRDTTEEVSLFSDGLQRLALVFGTESAHEPFFEPMFNVLRTSSDDQVDAICEALKRFLGSETISDRTDDDKTLILATRVLGADSVRSV
jgi:Protein phosphatase 2C